MKSSAQLVHFVAKVHSASLIAKYAKIVAEIG